MLALLAAAALAAPAPAPAADPAPAASPVLEASMPWWEKITVTVDDKGKQQSCRYEFSLAPSGAEDCDEEMAAGVEVGANGQAGLFSKVTFERRFSPGGQPDSGKLEPGDKLLGRAVMFLTIGAEGSIESCHLVATSGDNPPEYDCDEAKKEQFRVPASAAPGARQAFMTVLAYGHLEQMS